MRTLLNRWRSGGKTTSQAGSGMEGAIPLRLTGGLIRSAAAEGPPLAGEGDRPWDFEVVIARPGYSRDGRWFLTPGVLRSAAPLFEGVQAFANHAPPEGPDIKDLVGWHRKVRVSEEGLVSTFTVTKSAGWFHAMAHDALDRGIEEPFGFSFDVLAETEFREESGGLVLHFLKIVAVNSVDVVHKGRLGGALIGAAAAVPSVGGEEPIPRAFNSDMEVKMFERVYGKLKTLAPEVAARLGDRWTPQQLFSACEEAGFQWDIAGGGTGPDDCRELVTRRLSSSALPDAVKEKLLGQFAGRVVSESELDEAIRLESATLEKLTASGALRGFGASVEVVEDESDRKRAALDGLWDPVPRVHNGHRPYRFLSEGFQDFTGHRLSPQRFFAETFHYHRASENWNGIRRLSASLNTSTWGEAFGDSIRRALLRDFRDERFHQWKRIVSSVVPVKDFRTNRRVRVGGYGDLSTVSEQATYPALTSPTDEEVTYAVAKRGGIEDLTWEMIQNDDMGSIRMIPQRLARAAQRTLNKFVFDFLSANGTIYDGSALFGAGHNNTAANPLTYANVVTGIKAMGQQSFYGEAGVETASQARPRFLLHPTELLEEAFDITQSSVKIVTNEDSTQPSVINRLGVEPLWVPEFTDANDWFLVADPTLMDTIEMGFLDDQQEPELFIEDNPVTGSAFSADKIRYKIRHVYGGAVLDFRGFYRGAPA